MENTYNWEKFKKSKIFKTIFEEWISILNNTSLKERDYHHFLFKHPSIFLTEFDSYLVISKLKLGSNYETDFVIVKDGYSNGTIYEIIEIESPHTTLFDQKGIPSAKFNTALQQVRDWRRWMIENKDSFKKSFPTINTKILKDSKIKFKIIIGRRTENAEHLEKRKQIEEEQEIEILSYDRLTDIARDSFFLNEASIHTPQFDDYPFFKKNELGNPFYNCTTDSQWRKICNKGSFHYYSNMLDDVLKIRTYNKHFEEYKKLFPLSEY